MVMDVLIADVIKNLTEILVETSMMNIDFADFKRVMSVGGDATILYGESAGNDPEHLVKDVFSNSFLDADISTGKAALIHLTVGGSRPPSIATVGKIMEGLTKNMAPDANIIMGIREEKEYDGKIKAFMIVTGIRNDRIPEFTGNHALEGITYQ